MIKRGSYLPALIISSAGLIVYSQLIFHPFFLVRDPAYVLLNPMVLKGVTSDGLSWALTSPFYGYFAPITWLSHATDIELFGLWAGGHHLSSLLMHIFSALLLFRALNTVSLERGKSLAVAMFFLLHPLQVETVAWIASRKDILSGFFAMSALYYYALFLRQRSLERYLAVMVIFTLGLLSNTSACMLPVLFLGFDMWALRKRAMMSVTPRQLIAEKLPFFLMSLPFLFLSYRAQLQLGAFDFFEEENFTQIISRVAANLGFYLQSYFYPVALGFPYPPASIQPNGAIVLAISLAALTIIALVYFWRGNVYAIGWISFVAMLAPFAQVFPVGLQPVADRWMYLPGIGLSIAVVWILGTIIRPKVIAFAFSCVAFAVIALLSMQQTALWVSADKLFEHVMRNYPRNPVLLTYVSNLQAARKQWEESTLSLKEALKLDPFALQAFETLLGLVPMTRNPTLPELPDCNGCSASQKMNLALMQLRLSDVRDDLMESYGLAYKAQRALEGLASEFGNTPGIMSALAQAEWKLGKHESALDALSRAIALRNGGASDLLLHAAWHMELERYGSARASLLRAIRANPTLRQSYLMLADSFVAQGLLIHARQALDELLIFIPNDIDALLRKADLFLRRDQYQEALNTFNFILRIDPQLKEAIKGKEYVLGQMGQSKPQVKHRLKK